MPSPDPSLQISGRRQRGFTLLEILIAVLVLSLGLLGMVGLQTLDIQASRDAQQHSTASQYARELAEMLQTGSASSKLDSTDISPYFLTFDSAINDLATMVPDRIDCVTSVCNAPRDWSQWQMRDWLYRINADLPGTKISVCFDASPYDTDGLAQWACTNSGSVAVIKLGWTRASFHGQATGEAAFDRATTPAIVVPVSITH